MAKSVTEHLRDHIPSPEIVAPSYDQLLHDTGFFIKEFAKLMQNRVIMGRFRYGGDLKPKCGSKYRVIESCIKRLQDYQETGNTENLVDVANLCAIEFNAPSNKKAHWNPTDGSPNNVKRSN